MHGAHQELRNKPCPNNIGQKRNMLQEMKKVEKKKNLKMQISKKHVDA